MPPAFPRRFFVPLIDNASLFFWQVLFGVTWHFAESVLIVAYFERTHFSFLLSKLQSTALRRVTGYFAVPPAGAGTDTGIKNKNPQSLVC